MSNKLPPALIKSLKEKYNIEEELFFEVHEAAEAITSIRLNPLKPITEFEQGESIPWASQGRYLAKRPSFIADPLFHAGCYYVQEASSMFLEHILKQSCDLNADLRVLDLCAAPGGKSTLIASLISQSSLLVSNEIIKTRVPVLTDNMTKWGVLNSVVSNNDPKDFQRLESYFDVMVVDAPCSGSGMWRKDPDTVNEWSESNVLLCSQRQQRILADAYPALKEDGLLIYSTCSYSTEENEDIADWLCDTFNLETVKIDIDPAWNIVLTESSKHKCFAYRFYPHKVKGEGFFVSCFRKKEGQNSSFNARSRSQKPVKQDLEIVESWLNMKTGTLKAMPVKDGYSIINHAHWDDIHFLQSKLYLKKSGVFAGKIIGKGLIPAHELALSLIVSEHVCRAELTYDQAIAFLRKDDLRLDNAQTGWSLMCYQGFGLGWAKVLPNRINNYLPKEVRILKEIKDRK
ncbi:methyltransferase RsmF C-terminal domain-like protein [Desertivirga xinjiangensis]|uniref:methyltransferase RsmF C-terminal domain-like protein n=1 Tax=Desertivirga xinjiangensis TaxID=539206 RepID=UPI00210C9456|nr:RNA methyltransferase [Pedobacter xinjiangensis]